MELIEYVRGDKRPYIGKYRIDEYIIDKDVLKKGSWEKNLLTDKFKTCLSDCLVGNYDQDKHVIGKLAIGTGDGEPHPSDQSLENPLGPLKSYVPESLHNNTYSNRAEATYYFDSTEASWYGDWKEIGLYAVNEIDLLTRSLISPHKEFNNTKTMTVHYVIEF